MHNKNHLNKSCLGKTYLLEKEDLTRVLALNSCMDLTRVLAELSLKNPIVYTTSKFDAGEKHSSLHLSLKSPAIFKKLRAT